MGLSKPIVITQSAVDVSNLATKSDLTALQNTISNSVGAVKKIQRGTVNATVGLNATKNTTVTLSGFTNVSKMSVKLYGYSGFLHENSYVPRCLTPYVASLEVNKLTISTKDVYGYESGTANASTISYEVVEYK